MFSEKFVKIIRTFIIYFLKMLFSVLPVSFSGYFLNSPPYKGGVALLAPGFLTPLLTKEGWRAFSAGLLNSPPYKGGVALLAPGFPNSPPYEGGVALLAPGWFSLFRTSAL